MPPNIIHTKGGRLVGDTSRDDVRNMVSEAFSKPPPGGIVFHLHGGLVNKAAGQEIASRLIPEYTAAGVYPIVLVWETGIIETLTNNLSTIASEAIFQKVRNRVVKMVKRKFSQGAGDRSGNQLPQDAAIAEILAIEDAKAHPEALRANDPAPPSGLTELSDFEKLQLESELGYDLELITEVERVSQGLLTEDEIEAQRASRSAVVRGSTASLMDPEALEAYVVRPEPNARGIISTASFIKAVVLIAANVIKRYLTGRDHGFHATIVEEILRALYIGNAGKFVWSSMKADGINHFKGGGDFAGTAVLEDLATHLAAAPETRITLVGHSAGSIFASAFIQAADAVFPAETKLDVIYLAPAATMELTARTLADHVSRIRNFRMFAMTDENERKDVLVDKLPYFYPSSLLYLVSGLFEDETDTPITGMQRFHDANRFSAASYPHIQTIREFMNGHIIWSVSSDGGNGRNSSSIDHGAFDNDAPTLASLRFLLSNGF